MPAIARPYAALVALALLAAAAPAVAVSSGASSGGASSSRSTEEARSDSEERLPVVSPAPRKMSRAGADVPLPSDTEIVVGAKTDDAARRLLTDVLHTRGVRAPEVRSRPSGRAALTVLLGEAGREDIRKALRDTEVPDAAEAYALRVSHDGGGGNGDGNGQGGAGRGTVALGGTDAAGQFYAVQTFRQLIRESGHQDGDAAGGRTRPEIAGASVSDSPAMPLRGTIEGFYGPPWTTAERLDHMDFLGDVKSNTYVYAPKDDPYHREKWREPYPEDTLAELGQLVERARANHVRFTFALSPGTSICYSDPDDVKALVAKLQSVYDLGVRTFSVPLDDISYTKWNCDADREAFGEPGKGPAAEAQVGLLNKVQREFVDANPGTHPLQTVPTEYGDLTESAYKKVLREKLDDGIEIMWTGTDVVPPEITKAQAARASELFGRKVFVWDNYPVNDFTNTRGRLLLAPYDKRERGLSENVSGLVSNPMNQASASKLAVFTIADFAWNDQAYDPERSGAQAANYLAGGDARTAEAMRVFVDLNHAAPTFGDTPWQPQSPVLSGQLESFWKRYATDPEGALRELKPVVDGLVRTPATLREGVADRFFLADADRWLDATELWGSALRHGTRALAARQDGDEAGAAKERAAMDKDAKAASEITVDPEEHHQVGPVKIGDPFVEDFVTKVRQETGGE